MKNFKTIFNNFITLKWYYQLTIMLTTMIIVALFVKLLIWIIPILFESKVRQFVKSLSNGFTDCIVSCSKREPFLAIKIRLIVSNEVLVQKQHKEEDFKK